MNLGASLISEAVSDLWLAIDSAIHNKTIDWAAYLKGKAVSVMMAVGAAAWSTLSEGAKIAEAGVKEAAKEGTKEAVKEGFAAHFKRVFWEKAPKLLLKKVG